MSTRPDGGRTDRLAAVPGLAALRRLAGVDAGGTGDYRGPALAGVAVLTLSYVSVLYRVTDVVGGSGLLLLLVAGILALATALGRFLRVRTALVFTAVLLVGGLLVYFLSIPTSQLALLSAGRLVSDTIALLTGLSVLRLTAAGVWALAIAPGPAFLSWYLAIRGRYVWSVAAGGAALLFFVLTGDAGTVLTLAGVVGGTAAVGFGTLETYGGTTVQFDTLAMVVATMVVVSATLSLVPGGAAQPLIPNRGTSTVEASLVNADDNIQILGSIRLSPNVRFEVESPEGHYWQTAAYDRYTGDGWVRTGNAVPYRGRLQGPPGSSRLVEQTVTTETSLDILPAAWKPVAVRGDVAGTARVTPQGGLRPGRTLSEGERYTVESRVPQYTREQLRRTGTEYPDAVAATYLQLPESTSDRVRVRAAEIAGDETNPYDKAVAVEQWLEANKRYSLTVQRPDGNIADAFLFEMDAGYCTYYATTMVTLLRAQGVPARFVTGYTSGERVADDRYVVRGLDSHAWVEVYFADVGWVRFDPTPTGPRRQAELARIADARANNASGVDTDETVPTETPTPTTTPPPGVNGSEINGTVDRSRIIDRLGGTNGTNVTTPPGGISPVGGTDSGGSSGWVPDLPSRETVGLGLVAMFGLAAGARRTGLSERAFRAVWLRYQGARRDPEADAERAFDRLEYLLSRRYRPRRPGETPRAYLTALSRRGVDERAATVVRTYERARYGGEVSREEAEAAVSAVDAMVRESTSLPLLGGRGR